MFNLKSGINSQSFYGSNPIKRNKKKCFTEENETADRKKLLNGYSCRQNKNRSNCRTPPKRLFTPNLNSTEKIYSEINTKISYEELNGIKQGFNKKSSNNSHFGVHPKSKNRPKTVSNIRVDMKKSLDQFNDNIENIDQNSNEIKKFSKTAERITDYFASKPKPDSPFAEIQAIEENDNQMEKTSSGQKTPPLVLSNVDNLNEIQTTPKGFRFSDNTLNENPVNSQLFSDLNDFDDNIIDTQNHIFIDSPEKLVLEPNSPIGLRNLGNTCYMNSIVQSLFALNFFINDLENKYNHLKSLFDNFGEQTQDFLMTQKLLNLYNQYNGLRNTAENCSLEDLNSDLLYLKHCVEQKAHHFSGGSQQDAAEFFNYVIDSIDEEFDSKQMDNNPIWRNFSFETGGTLVCQQCKERTPFQSERFNALNLSIPSDNSLQTAFDDFLKDEMTGHKCNNCGANDNVLSKCFLKLPKVLFLSLARYNHDGSKRTEQVLVPPVIHLSAKSENCEQTIAPSPLATPYKSKLQNATISARVPTVVRKITFDNNLNTVNENLNNSFENSVQNPNEIILNDFSINKNLLLDELNSEDKSETVNQNDNRVKYQLVAVVCHHGISLSVGHYTCYVYSIENDQWFECDDNRISQTNFDSVRNYSQTSGYCYFYVLS